MTFHHLSGTFPQQPVALGQAALVSDTHITMKIQDDADHTSSLQDRWQKVLFSTQKSPDRSLNNGTVRERDEWLFERVRIPASASKGRRIHFEVDYDASQGAFGLDNIKLHTPQWQELNH